jgi:hypothetical protein
VKILLLAFVLLAWLAAGQAPAAETSIRHVTVISVATGAELKDQTVKIQGDRIVSIAATQETDAALPGGVDAHGASSSPGYGTCTSMCTTITSFRSM